MKKSQQVAGLETNINFLLTLASHPEFRKGNVHTNFIPDHLKELFPKKKFSSENMASVLLAQIFFEYLSSYKNSHSNDPFLVEGPFRLNHSLARTFKYNFTDKIAVEIHAEFLTSNSWRVQYEIEDGSTNERESNNFLLCGSYKQRQNDLLLEYKINNQTKRATAYVKDNQIHIFSEKGKLVATIPEPKYIIETQKSEAGDSAVSPMPGVVDKIFVKKDDEVKTGEPLLTIIAMKMEYIIKAPKDGRIQEILHSVGDSVAKNAVLIRFCE